MKNQNPDLLPMDTQAAAEYASRARTAPAGSYAGSKPASGPKKVGWKLNGTPAPKLGGVS